MSVSPQEAFKAVKILWPEAIRIVPQRNAHGAVVHLRDDTYCLNGVDVEWGKGIYQYPPAPEEWSDVVFPDDIGRAVRFRLLTNPAWHDAVLVGKDVEGNWVVDSVYGFIACRVCRVRKVKS
jgi:hypothetical protein